jgi:hypothetical protein
MLGNILVFKGILYSDLVIYQRFPGLISERKPLTPKRVWQIILFIQIDVKGSAAFEDMKYSLFCS